MAREQLSEVEKIARMVEWDDNATWTLDTQVGDDSLAAAQRYMAAQAFLLSWKCGRVPVGWQRARRLTDFSSSHPESVVDAAQDRINELIAERNDQANKRIARVAKDRRSAENSATKGKTTANKKENSLQLKETAKEFERFSDAFFEMKGALAKASAAVAELALRTQAAQEACK